MKQLVSFLLFAFLLFAFIPATVALGAPDDMGDAEAGAKIYAKCRSCHQVGQDAKNRLGPQLNGIINQRVATHEGYRYSDALKAAGEAGVFWNVETLDEFLENPSALVPKTKMKFRGLKNAADRANIIAYLARFTSETQVALVAPEVDLDADVLGIEGDPEYGAYLASDCQSCHAADGSDNGIPSIVNWPPEDFAVAMHAYKQKLRDHPIMQMMAGRLSNEEIAALAAYYGDLK